MTLAPPPTRTRASGRVRAARGQRGGIVAPLVLVAPFVLLIAVVYVIPLAYSAYRSFLIPQRSGLGFGAPEMVFGGFTNYARVLQSSDFWSGVGRVALYTGFQVPVMLFMALCLALLLDSLAARAIAFFRLTFFLPYAVPGVVATLLWAYLYVPQLSPLVKSLADLGIRVNFFGSEVVLFSMANIAIWTWTGYNVFIYFAALQAIPRDIYESARVDGASEWSIAWRIKFPMIRASVVLTGLLSMIGSIQLFAEPTILRSVDASSVTAAYVPMMMAYNATFGASDFEYGSAISIVIVIIAGILAFGYQRLTIRGSR